MSVSIEYKNKIINIDSGDIWKGGSLVQNTPQALNLIQSANLSSDSSPSLGSSSSLNPSPDLNLSVISINSISIDTRTLEKGALFVVIKGEKLDGHTYVELAIEKGAVACIVEENLVFDIVDFSTKFPHVFFIKTLSSLVVLQNIATQYRAQFSIPVIGITGSNGKTTTKNLIASILSKKYKTISTKGNLNNHIGLPLSILSIEPDTEIAVFEAGINHVGEMNVLSAIVQPTAVVVTNIGNAHIEFFGSKEAIAKEKAEIARSAPSGSMLYIPYSEHFADTISSAVPHMKMVLVEKDSLLTDKLQEYNFKYIHTPHVMSDVSLAIAVARQYGVDSEDIVEGILSAKLESGRFDIHIIDLFDENKTRGGLIVIDDTYNANPDSVRGSITAMRSMYPKHTLVLALGQLKEQGEFLKEGYTKIIKTAEIENIAEVFLVGISADDCAHNVHNTHDVHDTRSAHNAIHDARVRLHYFSSKQLCIDVLTTYIEEKKRGDEKLVILVKGSRSSKMEDVVAGVENVFKSNLKN